MCCSILFIESLYIYMHPIFSHIIMSFFGFYRLNEYGSSEKYMVPEEIDFAE